MDTQIVLNMRHARALSTQGTFMAHPAQHFDATRASRAGDVEKIVEVCAAARMRVGGYLLAGWEPGK